MNSLTNSPKWMANLSGRHGKDLRVLVFSSRKEFEEASQLFISDEELAKTPHEIAGRSKKTGCVEFALVVPVSAVPLVRTKGLKFHAVQPITLSDLTPRQYQELQRGRARLIEEKKLNCDAEKFAHLPTSRRSSTKR